jgi:hypothetical protein
MSKSTKWVGSVRYTLLKCSYYQDPKTVRRQSFDHGFLLYVRLTDGAFQGLRNCLGIAHEVYYAKLGTLKAARGC